MSEGLREDLIDEEKRLHEALCQFCNNATDSYEPVDKWDETVRCDLDELCVAYNAWYVERLLDPEVRAERKRWADACATASAIVDILKEDRMKGVEAPNLIESHLHRNIADAIYGTFKQTEEDSKAGLRPKTMNDALGQLIAGGKLFELIADSP